MIKRGNRVVVPAVMAGANTNIRSPHKHHLDYAYNFICSRSQFCWNYWLMNKDISTSRISILTLLWSICFALLLAFIPAAHAAQMGGAIQDTALPFTTSNAVVTTLAGSGTSGSIDAVGTAAGFNYPSGITTDGTNLYVADRSNHTIRKIWPDAAVPTVISTSPTNGAAGVPPNNNISITWDKNIDCATVNTTHITISEGDWALSSCSNNQATFTTS